MQPGSFYQQPPPKQPNMRRRAWIVAICTAPFFLCLFTFIYAASTAPRTPVTSQASALITPTLSITQTTIVSHATTAPTQTIAVTPTVQPTPSPVPTKAPIPTIAPTQPPTPTTAPPVPTQAPAQPTQPPAQQPTYDLNPNGGSLVYNPPADFCASHICVSTFWTATNGYVVECADGHYSHSGGVRGACSRNGGVAATLYSH